MATVVEAPSSRGAVPTNQAIGAPATGEQRFRLDAVDWPSYVKIAEGIGERHVRVTYVQGSIELMTTSYRHEWWSDRLNTIIKTLASELNIALQSGGSTTIRREHLARGIEPDQCYFIASARSVAGGLMYAGVSGNKMTQGNPPKAKWSPRVGGVYSINEKTSCPPSCVLPSRNASSMMNGSPTTTPPSCSTSSTVAFAVPPVARTSSWTRTR